MKMDDSKTVKIVLVGDSKCGKTSLIHRFMNDKFVELYTPTGFERYSGDFEIGTNKIHFTLWDTSGASSYDTVRPLAYQDAKVFLLCYTIGVPSSLDNAANKWHKEIRLHCPKTPIVLCGCMADLRSDQVTIGELANTKKSPVTAEQALAVSRQIGATTYVETSSKDCTRSVRDGFEVASLAAMGKLNKNRNLLTFSRSKKKTKHKKTENNNKEMLKEEIRAGNCTIL